MVLSEVTEHRERHVGGAAQGVCHAVWCVAVQHWPRLAVLPKWCHAPSDCDNVATALVVPCRQAIWQDYQHCTGSS
jgi:hypothetical protein